MEDHTPNDILFENKYNISENASYTGRIRPGTGLPTAQPSRVQREPDRKGNAIRIIGLIAAVVIIFISFVNAQPFFLFFGILLALIYVFRIFSVKKKEQGDDLEAVSLESLRPPSTAWGRTIQFSDRIRRIDPNDVELYDYRNLVRKSEDSAYCTLFFSDHSVLRVYKKGFTIGTYEDFEAFVDETIEKNRRAAEEYKTLK